MLFKVRMRLSHFDPLGPLNKIPESVICSDDGIALSHDGVRIYIIFNKLDSI